MERYTVFMDWNTLYSCHFYPNWSLEYNSSQNPNRLFLKEVNKLILKIYLDIQRTQNNKTILKKNIEDVRYLILRLIVKLH